jgi:phosphoglycolate phosphatase
MKLALFDVDGTLVDSGDMIDAAMAHAFAAEGLPPPARSETLRIVGLSLVDAVRTLKPGLGDEDYLRLANSYKAAFWDFRAAGRHPERLFAGAYELLAALRTRADTLIGIATGKSKRGVDHLIDAHGFAGWFATVSTSDDHPSKPHPAMVETALAATSRTAAATIVIGDTTYYMEMARAAGVGAIGVAWGNHDRRLLVAAGAHLIASDFNELSGHLESLWQERGT